MRCIAIRHVAFEDLGAFEPLLRERGFGIDYRQAGVDPISEDDWMQADLAVVLGGPIGINDLPLYPWIADELQLTAMRMRAELPLLGICLGAQMMAAALGAEIYPGPSKEIGWSELTLTRAGQASPLKHLADVNGQLQRALAAADAVFRFVDEPVEADGLEALARST